MHRADNLEDVFNNTKLLYETFGEFIKHSFPQPAAVLAGHPAAFYNPRIFWDADG
jgi:hypothetical protein